VQQLHPAARSLSGGDRAAIFARIADQLVAPTTRTDPEASLIWKETVRDAFAGLEERDRDLIALNLAGMSIDEIHREIGVPRSTVVMRLERAFRVLGRRRRHAETRA